MSASGSPTESGLPIEPDLPEKMVTQSAAEFLSSYRLLEIVGQGQFAQVYGAVHRRTGRLVAIKQTRHARETQSQAPFLLPRLKHPNIVTCHAVAISDSGYQLVLDYCEGGTLRSHLTSAYASTLALSLSETQLLIGGILQGLRYLHQQGIIHDDLKPENILLTYSTQGSLIPKIGDFGSAHLIHPSNQSRPNQSRHEIGSPTYAAPERFEGYTSTASDLYSVGVMLYELLIGDRPFSGNPDALKQAHQKEPVVIPPTLPPALHNLLSIALHKQPQQRFSSADDMLRALQSLSEFDTKITVKIAVEAPIETSIKTPVKTAFSSFGYLPATGLTQAAQPISSNGLIAPIDALISTPQGCCIVTEFSLHLLTPKRELLSIAQFRHPCWIAVAASGQWFVAFPKKKSAREETRSEYCQARGMLGHFSHQSGYCWRRSLSLTGPSRTELCVDVIQLIALDSRYLLRASTASSRTYLECFTRRGQFIGEVSLNIRLTQVVPTAVPYQLIALSTVEGSISQKTVVLITLKPLQVKQIRLSSVPASASESVSTSVPARVSALPWGYAVSYHRRALLLDRLANVTSVVTDVPQACAIAAIDAHSVLFASSQSSRTEISELDNLTAHSVRTSSPQVSSPEMLNPEIDSPQVLLTANIDSLDLGMIF